jgi:hypothetical protein
MHERFYKKLRQEKVQSLLKDKEAVTALNLLIEKGYNPPTIQEAYFLIIEDREE